MKKLNGGAVPHRDVDAARKRADPQQTAGILRQRPDGVGADAHRIVLIEPMMRDRVGCEFEKIDARVFNADPQSVRRSIDEEPRDAVAGDGCRRVAPMSEPCLPVGARIETHHAIIHRGHPEASAGVFEDIADILRRQSVRWFAGSPQTIPCANPELMLVVFKQRGHERAICRCRVRRDRHRTTASRLSIEREQTDAGADQEATVVILDQTGDDGRRDRPRRSIACRYGARCRRGRDRTRTVCDEAVDARIVATQAGRSHDPQRAASILVQSVHHADRQCSRGVTGSVVAEMVSIVPAHTARRGHPHESMPVLQNVADEGTGQSVIDAQMAELHALRTRRRRHEQAAGGADTGAYEHPQCRAHGRWRCLPDRAGE